MTLSVAGGCAQTICSGSIILWTICKWSVLSTAAMTGWAAEAEAVRLTTTCCGGEEGGGGYYCIPPQITTMTDPCNSARQHLFTNLCALRAQNGLGWPIGHFRSIKDQKGHAFQEKWWPKGHHFSCQSWPFWSLMDLKWPIGQLEYICATYRSHKTSTQKHKSILTCSWWHPMSSSHDMTWHFELCCVCQYIYVRPDDCNIIYM